MQTKLKQNEQLIKEGAANLQKGIETVGGKLYLTNQRLLFEAHKMNIQANNIEIMLPDIIKLKKCWSMFLGFIPLLPNSLTIHTETNNLFSFVLFNRNEWQTKINESLNA